MKMESQDGVDNEDYQILNMLLDYKLQRLSKQSKFHLSKKLLRVKELKNCKGRCIEEALSKTSPEESAKVKNKKKHYTIIFAALKHLGKTGEFPEGEMRQVSTDLFQKKEVGKIRPLEPVLLINKMFNIPLIHSINTLKEWAA